LVGAFDFDHACARVTWCSMLKKKQIPLFTHVIFELFQL
jgi:hypothetical protein